MLLRHIKAPGKGESRYRERLPVAVISFESLWALEDSTLVRKFNLDGALSSDLVSAAIALALALEFRVVRLE